MMHGWQSESTMDRKVIGVVLFGVISVVTSPTTAECYVVWCGVVCICSVVVLV